MGRAPHPDSPLAGAFSSSLSPETASKLTHEQRCEIFALYHSGVSTNLLATFYKVHKMTVRYIVRRDSAKYQEVKHEYQTLGMRDFVIKHVSDDLMRRVQNFERTKGESDETPRPERTANKAQGNYHRTSFELGTDTNGWGFKVRWLDASAFEDDDPSRSREDTGPGWYCLNFTQLVLQGYKAVNGPHRTSDDAFAVATMAMPPNIVELTHMKKTDLEPEEMV